MFGSGQENRRVRRPGTFRHRIASRLGPAAARLTTFDPARATATTAGPTGFLVVLPANRTVRPWRRGIAPRVEGRPNLRETQQFLATSLWCCKNNIRAAGRRHHPQLYWCRAGSRRPFQMALTPAPSKTFCWYHAYVRCKPVARDRCASGYPGERHSFRHIRGAPFKGEPGVSGFQIGIAGLAAHRAQYHTPQVLHGNFGETRCLY